MSLRNSVNPTNRVATNIIINPSPTTESITNETDYPSNVPAPSSFPKSGGGMHWDVLSFSRVFKKICSIGLPINKKVKQQVNRRRRGRNNIWCFQPKPEHHHAMDDDVWVAFERKNQIKLNEKFKNGSTDCDIRDRSIYRGEVTVKIMLRDGIGFIMDPEWQHVVYQIDIKPKMYWWQRVRYRAMLREKIKNNPNYPYI